MSITVNNEDDIQPRKVYEINELYQTGDPKLIDIALMIKEATKKAMDECVEKNNNDYSIFEEIEKKSIELEEKEYKERKKYIKGITKILANSNNININEERKNIPDCVDQTLKEIINQNNIQKVIDNHTLND